MISFKSGAKVAAICGGDYDGKDIYINNEQEEPDRDIEEEDIYDILDDEDFNMNRYKKLSYRDRIKLERALRLRSEPIDEYLVPNYQRSSQKLTEMLKKELNLTTGVMIPIPSQKSERIYIAGKSGSGKSCLVSLYAREYNMMFPKNQIFIFTKHEQEKAYKLIPHKEITCDNELLQEPLDIKLLSNSLVIFDDCDHVQDKTVSKNLTALNNDLITAGRKYNIHVVTLQHQLMDYKGTRNLLNESNKVVFFNSGSMYHITRYLKVYAGLAPETIKKVTALKSRWTMISLDIPTYILHEHGLFII